MQKDIDSIGGVVQNEKIQNEKIQNDKGDKGDKGDKNDKKKQAEFIMPTKEDYSMLLSKNYTIKQLREIACHHKIKLRGVNVKTDILARIYNYFKLYDNAVVIQQSWRRYLFRHYNQIRGPARFNRSLCVNDTDFFTMDDIKDIPFKQFFSFKDYDNTIYGFDIMSIYNLFDKGYDKVTNPYNRNPFPRIVKKNMLKIIWLSKLFKDTLQLEMIEPIENEAVYIPLAVSIENRVIDVFHDMDILGNYTHASWFLDLNQVQLVRFILELNDIWSYRAGLSDRVKRDICNDYRDLFRMIYIIDIRVASLSILRELCLNVIEKLVRDGVNRDHKCLGTNYVLCGLTLVSPSAAEALPWLYQSVA